jgi:hypothetical protein
MYLLVTMKTISVMIDFHVVISLVSVRFLSSVLVPFIVSSDFRQRSHSQAWLIGRCLS